MPPGFARLIHPISAWRDCRQRLLVVVSLAPSTSQGSARGSSSSLLLCATGANAGAQRLAAGCCHWPMIGSCNACTVPVPAARSLTSKHTKTSDNTDLASICSAASVLFCPYWRLSPLPPPHPMLSPTGSTFHTGCWRAFSSMFATGVNMNE